MTGVTESHEVPESDLSASIGALQNAVRSLRNETGRVTAALDGVTRALDQEGEVVEPEPSRRAAPGRPPATPQPVARTAAPAERIPARTDDARGQPRLWVSGLLCALALIASVALLKVELALAIPVVIVAAVLLQMKWWMPALAAVALALALAIESPSGPMADKVAAMCVVFVLTAGALLLYEIWQRLHLLRLQG